MPWAHFDDGLFADPRLLDAGLAAAGLYLCATSYMARYLTDGVIPEKALSGMLEAGNPGPLDALLRVGLFVRRDSGDYEAPEYLIGNWTREETERRRADTAKRKLAWKEKRDREKRAADG